MIVKPKVKTVVQVCVTIWIACCLCCIGSAQTLEMITANTVMSFSTGSGQSTGQQAPFFPMNIFGPPSATATATAPTTNPREICSLGLGGSITIGFTNHMIVDKAGPDFVIYENAFEFLNRVYAEPAKVAVSKDGVEFFEFPFDSATLAGCAGVTPTYGGESFNPSTAGGDAFDLQTIGVDSIRWIRITDITAMVLTNPNHAFYDPTLTGFDFDAVVSTHGVRLIDDVAVRLIPRTATIEVEVPSNGAQLEVYNVRGELLDSEQLHEGLVQRSFYHMPAMAVLVVVKSDNDVLPLKVLR